MTIHIEQFSMVLWLPEGDEPPPPPPVTPTVRTLAFGEGLGSNYWALFQLSDSGDELRSKTVKSGYVVSRATNSSFIVYGFDVAQPIDIAAMERGERIAGGTRAQHLLDTTEVEQSARKQINVKNAVVHTIRIQGNDEGNEVRDRIDQACYEVAQQGVRR